MSFFLVRIEIDLSCDAAQDITHALMIDDVEVFPRRRAVNGNSLRYLFSNCKRVFFSVSDVCEISVDLSLDT